MACVVALLHDTPAHPACADAGAVDTAGWNLLMHACVSGHLDLVNLLLQNKEGNHPEMAFAPLDVNHGDASGVNALAVAAREGHWQLLPSLVLAGLNTSARDRDGFTAVHWAAIEDEPLTMKCLLDLNLDVDAKDSKGWTPLMHACARGADEVVRVLVDFHAKLDERNWDGDTALQITTRRRDPEDIVMVTKDILLDGVMEHDEPSKGGSVQALGHMMVSVLEATDLYLEGKTGFVNTYVNLQLRMQNGARPQAAFTSCVLQNSSPEWHEVFRFDTTRMDPSAVLVAWVVAAPGDNAEEVVQGTALGLTEEELKDVAHMEAMTGTKLHDEVPVFTSSMQESFQRLMRRADREEDSEVMRLRKLAMAQLTDSHPTQDLKYSQAAIKGKDGLSLGDRRWMEVTNLREILLRSGCDLPEPLAPRTHFPLGCVVVRYRHLRAAVWGSEPVTVVRTLRLSCRGSLRVQIDFRPKFFECKEEERAKQLSPEEEDEIYGLQPVDDEDLYKEALLSEEAAMREAERRAKMIDIVGKQKAKQNLMNAQDAAEQANRLKHVRDPEALLKRFRQVSYWANSVMKVKEDYKHKELQFQLASRQPKDKGDKRMAKKQPSTPAADPRIATRAVNYVVGKYKGWKAAKAASQVALDRPIGSTDYAEAAEEQAEEDGVARVRKLPLPTIPSLKAERWVEDFMETSRLV